jgi:hypothetical protein
MPQRIAFTGPSDRHISPGSPEWLLIASAIGEFLEPHTHFLSGGAHGVDAAAGKIVLLTRTTKANPHPLTWVLPFDRMYDRDTVTQYRAPRIEVPGTYMARNDRLIAEADVLLAFPPTPHEITRSGTWATVRRARRKGIPVHLYPLSGATHA